jgi:hypothetical protein
VLIPLLRERIQTIKQKTDQAYAGLAGGLSLRDRNLILAQLDILRKGSYPLESSRATPLTTLTRYSASTAGRCPMTCYACGTERCEDQLSVCPDCRYGVCGMDGCEGQCACEDNTGPERRAWDSVAYAYYHQYHFAVEYCLNTISRSAISLCLFTLRRDSSSPLPHKGNERRRSPSPSTGPRQLHCRTGFLSGPPRTDSVLGITRRGRTVCCSTARKIKN